MKRRRLTGIAALLALTVGSARVLSAESGEEVEKAAGGKGRAEGCHEVPDSQGPPLDSAGCVADSSTEEEAPGSSLRLYYQDGLRAATADGSVTVVLDGTSQVDYRYGSVGGSERATFMVRRAQLGVGGTLYRLLEWRVKYEMGSIDAGMAPRQVALEETYVGLQARPWAVLRVGLLKVPLESEFSKTAHRSLDFAERSWAKLISPGRDMGAQLAGDVLRGRVDYAVGVFNGASNDSAGKAVHDTNTAKDWAGQVRVRPFGLDRTATLGTLQLSGGFTTGRNAGDPIAGFVSQETAVRVVTVAPQVVGSGRRERRAVDGQWFVGPLGLKAEYAAMDNELGRGDIQGQLRLQAYYASVTWLVTGERKTVDIIHPRRPLRRGSGWGSLELGARVSGFLMEESRRGDAAEPQLIDPLHSARRVRSVTLGLSWRPHAMARVMLNYVSDRFSDPVARVDMGAEARRAHAWLVRFQGDF